MFLFFKFESNGNKHSVKLFSPLNCCPDPQEEEMTRVGPRKKKNTDTKNTKVDEERDFQFHGKTT